MRDKMDMGSKAIMEGNAIMEGKAEAAGRKAQISGADFLMSIVIILVLIGFTNSLWNRSIDSFRKNKIESETERLALSISSLLVRSEGIPSDWDEDNVVSIGLASRVNVIDPAKIDGLINMDEDKAESLMGIPGHGFNVRIRAANESLILDKGNYPSEVVDIVSVRRLVIYEENPVSLEFMVWEE